MYPAGKEKEVSVFRNGRSRAVRIPGEFELNSDKVLMSQDQDGTIHIKPKTKALNLLEVLDWLAGQEDFDEELPDIDDPPPEQVTLSDNQ